MKAKLFASVFLIFAMTGMALAEVDFLAQGAGTSIEGVLVDGVTITSTGNVTVLEEANPVAVTYGADAFGTNLIQNGCLPATGGFADMTKAHVYDFAFEDAVSQFSLIMYDFGDYNPSKATNHVVTLTGYDALDNPYTSTLSYTSTADGNPLDLKLAGDACAAAGDYTEPGLWKFALSGADFVRATIRVEEGADPNIAFGTLEYELACQPEPEVCDGVDNDCDGFVDEDLTPPSRECSVGVGACLATGTEYATCNGVEGWSEEYSGCDAVPGTPSEEVCDGLDNDCDELTDEDLTRPTTCGEGACSGEGYETCSTGEWVDDTCLATTQTEELLAGQDILSGDVVVEDNGDGSFTVMYNTQEGWEMTEVHLSVECSAAEVPRTEHKKTGLGGPIPGQFEFSDSFDPAVTSWEHVVTPGCADFVVAAHAVVRKANDPETVSFVSNDVSGIMAWGPLLNNPGVDGEWGDSFPAVLAWTHPSWQVWANADWISTNYTTEEPYTVDTWRKFSHEVSLPEDAVVTSSSVYVTTDNSEEVYLNGVLVGSNNNWQTPTLYALNMQPGPNTLAFIAKNAPGSNSYSANPAGLLYEGDVEYFTYQYETAWGDGARFVDQGNWATYMAYVCSQPEE